MSDDDLGRFLRSEVPEPGTSYWDDIDRRVERAAAELSSTAEDPVPGDSAAERAGGDDPDPGETDGTVIRLTDMNQAVLTQKRSQAPLILAAAAVIVAVVGFVTLRNSTVFQSIDTVGSADQVPADDAVAGDADSSDGRSGEGDTAGSSNRICYAGTIAPDGEVPGSDTYAWVERDGQSARVGILLAVDGFRDAEVGDGLIDADGVFNGTTRSSLGTTNVVDTLVITDEALSDTVAPIRIPAVPCDDVADEIAILDEAAARIEAAAATEGAPDDVTVEAEPARVWTVTSGSDVSVRTGPGDVNPAITTAATGTLLGGAGGAAVAQPDGSRWLAVYVRAADGIASLGWVSADDVAPTRWPDRLCFSSAEPASVLVLDPLSPTDTPLGALVTLSENPLVDEPEVRLVATAPPSSPDEAGDELSVYLQAGDRWEPQMWAQTSFGVAGPGIVWDTVDCEQVGEALASIEAFRNEIPLPDPGE